MSTTFTARTSITPTVMTGRTSIARTNTLAVIIAGVWIDGSTWSETGKFWNDAGDGSGTAWTGRTIPA